MLLSTRITAAPPPATLLLAFIVAYFSAQRQAGGAIDSLRGLGRDILLFRCVKTFSGRRY